MNGNPQTEIYLNLTSCRAAKKETIIHAQIKSPRINVPDKTTWFLRNQKKKKNLIPLKIQRVIDDG